MYNKPTKFDKIIVAIFEEMKILNFFLRELPLILRVDRKKKKRRQEILARGLQISNLNNIGHLVLGATLRDRQKIENYFSSFKYFSGKS